MKNEKRYSSPPLPPSHSPFFICDGGAYRCSNHNL